MMIDVAIIDNGIRDQSIPVEKEINFISTRMPTSEHPGDDYKYYEKYHGTICAEIIYKYCRNVRIYSLKIFDETLETNLQSLMDALEWCWHNRIKVINFSVGTVCCSDFPLVEEMIQRLTTRGVCIVAALNNSNYYTMPASLPSVLGVIANSDLNDHAYIGVLDSFVGVDIVASARHKIKLLNNEIQTPPFNSFSVPFVVSQVCNILSQEGSVDVRTIKSRLIALANENVSQSIDVIMGTKKIPLVEGTDLDSEIKIPVVEIVKDSSLARYLQEYLNKRNYYAIVVSDIPGTVFLLGEFFRNHWNRRIYLNAVYQKYNCDIIIVLSKSSASSTTPTLADILIEKKCRHIWEISFENTSKKGYSQRSICRLLTKILTDET